MIVLDGVTLRAEMIAAIRAGGHDACLATVVVGDNPRCHAFARDKRSAAAEAGLTTTQVDLTGSASQHDVEDALGRLAADPAVNGVFLQLPIPGHLDLDPLVELLPPGKDVDGMSPVALHPPTTAHAVIRLLDRYDIPVEGRRIVVVGGSPRVARAVAMLLTIRGADVTSLDDPVPDVCRRADILVTATGRPRTITADHLRPGAAVVDVTGDVDIASVSAVARAVAPYPTGVGPVAVACLLRNTVDAASAKLGP